MPDLTTLSGKYITFVCPTGGMPPMPSASPIGGPGLFGQSSAVNTQIHAPGAAWVRGVRPGAPAPAAPAVSFHATGQTSQFTFLNYVPGKVTVASLATPVLTGPMSGCYLFRFRYNGQAYLAHVGTANEPSSAQSLAAKADWNQFVSLPGVSDIWGGSPADFISHSELMAHYDNDPMGVAKLGYFVGNDAHALLFVKVTRRHNPPPTGLSKVALIKRMTLQPWSSIGQLRTFAGHFNPVNDPNVIKLGR